MRVVVPFAADAPKSRLSPVLSSAERRQFAYAMLADVCDAITKTGHQLTILATAPLASPLHPAFDDLLRTGTDAVSVRIDDRPLSDAVNTILETTTGPVAIVMADLALVTPRALERLFSADGDVVVAPGRGGGTNALVVAHPAFRVDYHGASYLDHRRAATEIGATLTSVDSYRLSTDVDEPEDLVEAWLHGGKRSRATLEQCGFSLEYGTGRVTLTRDGD